MADQSSNIIPSSMPAYAALLRDAQTLRAYGIALRKTGDVPDEWAFYGMARRYAYRVLRGPVLSDPSVNAMRASAQAVLSEIEPRYDAFVKTYTSGNCSGFARIDPSGFVAPDDPRTEKARALVQAFVFVDSAGMASSVKVLHRIPGDAALDAAVTRAALATRYDVSSSCLDVPWKASYAALFDPDWPADVVITQAQMAAGLAPGLPCNHEEATVTRPVATTYPDDARDLKLGPVTVIVRVDLDASGAVTQTAIARSSGNVSIDMAAIAEARASGYAPAIRGCKPVRGSFLFRAEFNPD